MSNMYPRMSKTISNAEIQITKKISFSKERVLLKKIFHPKGQTRFVLQ